MSLNKEIAIKLVKEVVDQALTNNSASKIQETSKLIGSDALLDSMQLVEVCLALEDIADSYGFEFDWTSESAMSKSRSMFRSVKSLGEEFAYQSEHK